MQRWRLPQRLMHQEAKPRKSVYQEPVHTYPPHPNIRTVSQFVWAPCDGDWKWLPFCGEEKYMYPLSLRVGDRGGPNLQPPIPSLCTATPSFEEKNHCCLLPPPPPRLSPASYPFRNLTSRSFLLLLPVPYSPGLPDCEKKVLFHTLQNNIYALFKEGALLKIYLNRLW